MSRERDTRPKRGFGRAAFLVAIVFGVAGFAYWLTGWPVASSVVCFAAAPKLLALTGRDRAQAE